MAALQKTRPVIFLAFANSSANPLPHLAEECRRLTDILEDAAHEGICDLRVRSFPICFSLVFLRHFVLPDSIE